MKKIVLSLLFSMTTLMMFAQCGELFISEYVEGYANNKALEIYNPTGQAVNLSQYSIARFSNGNQLAPDESQTPAYMVALPNQMLDPYDVFVIVIDLRDTSLWDSQFDKPAWNGFNLIDTLFDVVTGLPVVDSLGNVILGPQYDDGNALFGTVYNEEYDLQGKADVFLCPDYDTNRSMYFNGNDAVALIKSQAQQLPPMYADVVDVVGVIGEDPTVSIGQDAWVNADGFWLTKDRTLVRNPDVAGGTPGSAAYIQTGGTFTGEGWESYRKNDFSFLGAHGCVCDPDFMVSTENINQIKFEMFPNPTQGQAVQLIAEDMMTQVDVINLLGQTVSTRNYAPTNSLEVPTNNLDKGVYFVNVWFGEDQRSVKKLIIE